MNTKSMLLACMAFLTAIVVLSVGRIEYLNAAGGHVLPRHLVEGKPRSWNIADLGAIMEDLDQRFLDRRQLAAGVDAYDKGEKEPAAITTGAPYSVSEQRAIDTVTRQHNVLTKLHWSIKNIGLAQYVIAPTALLLCIGVGLAMKGWKIKAFAVGCSILCLASIFLILIREYWYAL